MGPNGVTTKYFFKHLETTRLFHYGYPYIVNVTVVPSVKDVKLKKKQTNGISHSSYQMQYMRLVLLRLRSEIDSIEIMLKLICFTYFLIMVSTEDVVRISCTL